MVSNTKWSFEMIRKSTISIVFSCNEINKIRAQQWRWPERTFSPVRASTGQWVLKNGGPLSYLEGFRVTQKNRQYFAEWRLERCKKLDVKTHPILSQVRWNQQPTWQQLWGKYGQVLVKSTSAVVKLNIYCTFLTVLFFVLCCVVLCCVV